MSTAGARSLVVATLLRPQGETGVQAHFGGVLGAAEPGLSVRLATPFDLPRAVVYPVFGLGRLLRPLSRAAWVWWYREGHYRLLRRRLMEVLRRGGPAVVYAQDPLSAKAALEARDRGLPVEVALAVHFNVSQAEEWAERGDVRRGGRLYRAIEAVEREVLPRVDRLVFPSEFMRRTVVERIPGAARVPSRCIPNFASRPAPGSAAGPRGELVSIGTLEPRKNQAFLLRVLARCHALGHPYRLTLVGDGPDRRALEELARALGLGGHVTFTGYRPAAAALLPGHRAYVHAARVENLPIALLEALAAGLPVLAAPVGGIPEVLRDGVEGRWWELDDPEEAARRLADLLEDPGEWERASRAARERYESRFAPERVLGSLLEAVLGPASSSGWPAGRAAAEPRPVLAGGQAALAS